MKTAMLVGAGAEIGSNLLLLNNPEKDGFAITTVLTNTPPVHKNYPHLRPIDGIIARLALAQPGAHALVQAIDEKTLKIGSREVKFEFCDLRKEFPKISTSFDIAFLATSKADISAESAVVSWLKRKCHTILGVAEANDLPSIYSCLADLSSSDLPTAKTRVITDGVYCLGSCQTNGMHASLRIVIDTLRTLGLTAQSILAVETDIIHPDTPNGVLGTRSFEGRDQDARNNLRPSFSQITQSQTKVMPWAPLVNTISLRAPVHAPGFQINRFIVQDRGLMTREAVEASIDNLFDRYRYIAQGTTMPLGSRAYAHDHRCATILTDPHHLLLSRPSYLEPQGLSQLTIQSFVNNTVGYSSLAISAASNIALGLSSTIF